MNKLVRNSTNAGGGDVCKEASGSIRSTVGELAEFCVLFDNGEDFIFS